MNTPELKSIQDQNDLFSLLAIGQILLIAVTWNLWIPQHEFPQVPLLSVAGHCPRFLEWLLLIGMLTSLLVLLFALNFDRRRIACITSTICQLGLVFVDQHRLQPWVWEFVIVSLVLATADSPKSRQLWRWLVIGIYGWSAWSKIDYGFCLQHGPFLLDGICKALHFPLATRDWPVSIRLVVAGAIPFFELLVAAGLIWHKSRRAALWGAAIMHIGLLLSLGPLGHNHRAGVLVWNLFFLVQNGTLFRRKIVETRPIESTIDTTQRKPIEWGNSIAQIIVLAALVWPVSESFGFCDHWPAWAVYAAKPERVNVLIHQEELEKIPTHLKQYLAFESFTDEWTPLRIDRWSLNSVLSPIYPQDRFQVGVALGIVDEFELHRILVVIEGPANRWSGKRTIRQLEGIESLEQWARTYRLNARPRHRFFH